eukprot:1344593-Amorphochlora_amoeboformis.AAC.1
MSACFHLHTLRFAAHAFLSLGAASGEGLGMLGVLGLGMPLKVQLVAWFYTVYGIAIALAKDVPDVKG